jgi:hypothetical protein
MLKCNLKGMIIRIANGREVLITGKKAGIKDRARPRDHIAGFA